MIACLLQRDWTDSGLAASVFAGAHHHHDPLRDGRIARIRRVIDEVTVVVIDLEQDFDIIEGYDRAVVFAVRVICDR